MGNVLSYTCNGLGDRLLQSCADGDLVAVRQLLQEHSRLCFWYRFSDGSTPLHIAAASGQLDIALRLIETASKQRLFETPREAEIAAKAVQNMLNARNSLGQTPLMLACRQGRADIAKLLLAKGANPLALDSFQCKSCLHYAAQFGWGNCCNVLLGDTIYMRGTQQLLRNVEIRCRNGRTRRFIDMDAQSGYTALHIAASHGHLETTKVLLKHGASLTAECQGSARSTAPFSRSARLQLMGRSHMTALHIAAARRNIPMCRAMLQAHAVYVASVDSAVGGGQPEFDIRNMRDQFDQRPVDIAMALNCAPLAAMLDPSLPLSLATAGRGDQGPLGPQLLSDLATAALRNSLLDQLSIISKAAEQNAQDFSARTISDIVPRKQRQSPGPPLSIQGHQTAGVTVSAPKGSSAAIESTKELSLDQGLPRYSHVGTIVSQSSLADATECGICLDHTACIAIQGCGHHLCPSCATQICSGSKDVPPICPFCRSIMGCFTPRDFGTCERIASTHC